MAVVARATMRDNGGRVAGLIGVHAARGDVRGPSNVGSSRGHALPVQVTIHGRLEPNTGAVSWDGYFMGDQEEMAQLADADVQQPRLTKLQIRNGADPATVRITEIMRDHGEFEGVGDLPIRPRGEAVGR